MDEFTKLKEMWNSSFDKPKEALNTDELLKIMQKKSTGPVAKLKKSLYIEIGATLLVIPLLIVVLIKLPQVFYIMNTSILLALFVGILIYYYIHLRKITVLWNQSQDNLRQSLESTLVLLRFFRKTYFILNIFLFPVGIYFGYIIGFGLGSDGNTSPSGPFIPDFPFYVNVLIWIVGGLLIVGLFLLFLRFYVRRLYDVHIKKLQMIHKELTENEY
jgi:hypothetical protein